MNLESIFLKNDIRGIYNEILTDELGRQVGNYFTRLLPKHATIVIGGDSRLSTPALKSAIIAGLIDAGVTVYDLGLVPTPTIYFSCATNINIDAGIIVTASHNPKEYNGIKLCDATGAAYTFDAAYSTILQAFIDKLDYIMADSKGEVVNGKSYVDAYIQFLQAKFQFTRPMKILVEYGNGAAGLFQRILTSPLTVVALHERPNGNFPFFIPDPTKLENYKYVKNALQNTAFDIAISFDGDGDRVGFMTGSGNLITADHVINIYAREFAKQQPPHVMIDVKISNSVVQYVESLGGKVYYTQVGHSFVHENLLHSNATFAGELSGHYYFNFDYYGFDDALFAALFFLKILENLLCEGINLDKLITSFPHIFVSDEVRVHMSYNHQKQVLLTLNKYVKQHNGTLITIDGIRGEFTDGWFIVRTSGTEELLSYRVEGKTLNAKNKYLTLIKSIIKNRN